MSYNPMNQFETKALKPDVAVAVLQNFRWFGYYCRLKPVSKTKTLVTCRRWAWSFFVLIPEDYA